MKLTLLILAVRRSLNQENFNPIEFELNIEDCFHAPCSSQIDLIQNFTILNGTSIVCDQSKYLGVVIKSNSKDNFYFEFKKIYINISQAFLGFTESNEIEFILLSETSFTGLETFKNDQLGDLENDPIYEEVNGFEPLRNIFKKFSKTFSKKKFFEKFKK